MCRVPGVAPGSWIKVVASLPGQERWRDMRPDLSWSAQWESKGHSGASHCPLCPRAILSASQRSMLPSFICSLAPEGCWG